MIVLLVAYRDTVALSMSGGGWKRAQRAALQLPPRCVASDDLKKGTISRAEGGQLQAPVGPLVGDVLR